MMMTYHNTHVKLLDQFALNRILDKNSTRIISGNAIFLQDIINVLFLNDNIVDRKFLLHNVICLRGKMI